jgi:hypothetical protein
MVASESLKRCPRCGFEGPRDTWPRYQRNGRLTVCCASCNEEVALERPNLRHRGATERLCTRCRRMKPLVQFLLIRGGRRRHPYCHECRLADKREHREVAANAAGRELSDYTPQPLREFRAALERAEKRADAVRRKFFADWLRPFRVDSAELYRADDEYREQVKERYRQRYAQNVHAQRAKVAEYKATHPERVEVWHETRAMRIRITDDGTLPLDELNRMKREARECAYCGAELTAKSTDHMIALCHGGEHSRRNVVIVCPSCNARKAMLTYEEWIERVSPEHRARVEALWVERHGA